jgi:hypothetical protein
VRIYLSTPEANDIAGGTLPHTVIEKVAAKLKPPAPIAGQLDIITALADHQEVLK